MANIGRDLNHGFKKLATSKTRGVGLNHGVHRMSGISTINKSKGNLKSRSYESKNVVKHTVNFAQSQLKKESQDFFTNYNYERTKYLANQIRKSFENSISQNVDNQHKDRYVTPAMPDYSGGSKIGVSISSSIGAQYGEVVKLGGIGVGFAMNLGSYDLISGQADILDGVKGSTPFQKRVIKSGGEIAFAAVGAEFGFEQEEDFINKTLTEKSLYGANLGPVKIIVENIDEYAYDKKAKKYVYKKSYSRPFLSLFESKVKLAYGGKIEVKGEITLNLADITGYTSMKVYDARPWESRADATRVYCNSSSIKKNTIGYPNSVKPPVYTIKWRSL